MARNITILGSLNIDLVTRVPHHPLPGETLTASSFSISPGGKGANQAVACAKLSRPRPSSSSLPSPGNNEEKTKAEETAHIRMVGSLGPDSYGTTLLQNLSVHGVDTSGIRVLSGEYKTGIAFIIVDEPTGENRIILSPEANWFYSSPTSLLSSPDTLRGSPVDDSDSGKLPDLLIMQLEIPLATVLAALRAARNDGVKVLFNPAPAQHLPLDIYRGLEHLVVNETEAAMLASVDVSVLDTEEGCEKVAGEFVSRGVKNVVITLGGRGVYYMNDGKKKGLVPAEKAAVVDTTGAGDTFVGRYALDVVEGDGGFEIEKAVRKANRAAKMAVERRGAADSIPWRDELE
ncbi:Ribokinase-like protein [Echria macrotheca]|uniref:Ribokinase n=1 Tax=Echria macrotheca TaxID=438768 RepID=A0AAJ0FDH0_9PEZI|nr:Ribokinase-like protein [Echria macrotheca]